MTYLDGFEDYEERPLEAVEDAALARRALSEKVRIGQELMAEFEGKGALLSYLKAAEAKAVEALVALIDVDPVNVGAVAALQQQIAPYLEASLWIRQSVDEAEQAQQEMERTSDEQPLD